MPSLHVRIPVSQTILMESHLALPGSLVPNRSGIGREVQASTSVRIYRNITSHIMSLKFLAIALLGTFCAFSASARDIAVKTNLLYDATLTINVGGEVQIAPKWSFDLSGNYNPWTLSDGKKWKHWLVQPELRYWFCEPLGGHFVAAHLLGGQYNMGHWGHGFKFLNNDAHPLADHRYQGWFAGAGIAYGYSWLLGRHWNLEAEIGIGWAYTRYDTYECKGCGRKIRANKAHNYVGPTKAALSLVYVF